MAKKTTSKAAAKKCEPKKTIEQESRDILAELEETSKANTIMEPVENPEKAELLEPIVQEVAMDEKGDIIAEVTNPIAEVTNPIEVVEETTTDQASVEEAPVEEVVAKKRRPTTREVYGWDHYGWCFD